MAWTRFHPSTRITIVVATVLIIVSSIGWDRVGIALANFSPRGSFETQCEALPGSAVDVMLVPTTVVENRSTPYAALGRMMTDVAPTHRTIGLTHGEFGHRSTVDVQGLRHDMAGRVCARPRVVVELSVAPITLYIAREYVNDECQLRVIREHEQRHVDVFTAFAEEAPTRLQASLAETIGTRPHYGSDMDEVQHRLEKRIGATLTAFMRDAERVLAERQAAVDTPEEYARVTNACLGG